MLIRASERAAGAGLGLAVLGSVVILALSVAEAESGYPGGAERAEASVTGCIAKGPSFRDSGPGKGRRVALTFDGGPTKEYTPRVLSILRRFDVRATFFVRGSFAANHRLLLRRIHRQGHELANHSYTHPRYPSGRELQRTNRVIRRTTGFKPCLFRAPYGAINDALIERARNQGMLTIGWDVDSWDGFIPNLDAGTIFSRVTGMARPGSIVLMHDGLGLHEGTIKALPRILRRLKTRNLRQVTVSQLLGLRQLTTAGFRASAPDSRP